MTWMLPTHIDVRSSRLQTTTDDSNERAQASGSDHGHGQVQRRWENDGSTNSHRSTGSSKLSKKKPSVSIYLYSPSRLLTRIQHGQDWKQIRQHNLPPRMRANSSASSSGHGHGSINTYSASSSPTATAFASAEAGVGPLLNRNSLFVDNEDAIYRTEPKSPSMVANATAPRTSGANIGSTASSSLLLHPHTQTGGTLPTVSLSPPSEQRGRGRNATQLPLEAVYAGGNPLTTPASYLQPQPLAVVHHHHHHHHYHTSPATDDASSSGHGHGHRSRSNSVTNTVTNTILVPPSGVNANTGVRPARNLPPRLQNQGSNPDLKITRASGTSSVPSVSLATGTGTVVPSSSAALSNTNTKWEGLLPEDLLNEEVSSVAGTSGSRNEVPAYHNHLLNLRRTLPTPPTNRISQYDENDGRRQSMFASSVSQLQLEDDAIAVSGSSSTLRRSGSIRRPAGAATLRTRQVLILAFKSFY